MRRVEPAAPGMSFVEMLVAITIVAIVLLAAGTLLVRLTRQTEEQARRAPAIGGITDQALDQMEADVRRCASMRRIGGPHGEKVLILDMTDGERVTWLLVEQSLRRQREPLGGQPFDREVAAGVALLDWERRSSHLFDLRLRRNDELVRQRTVLMRNVDRAPVEAPP